MTMCLVLLREILVKSRVEGKWNIYMTGIVVFAVFAFVLKFVGLFLVEDVLAGFVVTGIASFLGGFISVIPLWELTVARETLRRKLEMLEHHFRLLYRSAQKLIHWTNPYRASATPQHLRRLDDIILEISEIPDPQPIQERAPSRWDCCRNLVYAFFGVHALPPEEIPPPPRRTLLDNVLPPSPSTTNASTSTIT